MLEEEFLFIFYQFGKLSGDRKFIAKLEKEKHFIVSLQFFNKYI